jgi:hypothetical protein
MPSVCITGPHRYPDLARLWYRSVARDVAPVFQNAGWDVAVKIYCDSGPANFPAGWLHGAELDGPRPGARDFVEFYGASLEYPFDFLFFVDADLFITDGSVVAEHLRLFDDPDLAAISFLKRAKLPGVYALLLRREAYREMGPDVLAATYEGLETWPDAVNRGPGENAAVRLEAAGKRIVDITAEAQPSIADFHGTTVIRASRDMFAEAIGEEKFEALIGGKRYFCMGAYDNLLLGNLYRQIFHAPFAAGSGGAHMEGSVTEDALRAILRRIEDENLIGAVASYFERSNQAISRLAAREGLRFELPPVIPQAWGLA